MRHHVTIGFLSLIITIIAGCATHPSVDPTQPTYTIAVERDNFNSTDVSPGSTLPRFDLIKLDEKEEARGALNTDWETPTNTSTVAGNIFGGAMLGAAAGLATCAMFMEVCMPSLSAYYWPEFVAIGAVIGAVAGANRETLDMSLNRRLIPEESQVGMDDNLDKPLKSGTLLSKLQYWLPHKTETTTVDTVTENTLSPAEQHADNSDKPLKSDTLLSKLQYWLPHKTETTTVEVLTN